ncbi:MAG: hypothetical protein JNK14_04600 [Chitinophagaceae bacterium]|nr:hypothetical protein [Chitinophagaceae bacterium]
MPEEIPSEKIVPTFKQLRNKFWDIYNSNKIVFSISICEKIGEVIAAIDNYIIEYEKGVTVAGHFDTIFINGKEEKYLRVAGIWSAEAISIR